MRICVTLLLLGLVALLFGCSSSAEEVPRRTDAVACGSCHTTEYGAWSTSRLAASGTSPLFEALSAAVAKSWGDPAKTRCVTCHQPGFGGDHGIGCAACHGATGNLAPRDGLLTVDVAGPMSGPFSDPVATSAHESRGYGFLESPALCGTCHEVTGPRLFHETTLDEFEASSASSHGADCISCHMQAVERGPIALGQANDRTRADHAFVGFDPPWGAAPAVAERAASRTLQLLRYGIVLNVARSGAGIDVTLSNGAGHAVPTGIAFVRTLWVDVELTGADGEPASLPAVLELGSRPTRHGTPVALITDADAVESHVLASGATRSVHVDFPASLAAPVRAVVTLRARAVRADVLEALGLEDRAGEVPTHEVSVVRLP